MRNKWSRFEKAVNVLCGISMALIGLWMCHNFYKIYERDHLKPSVASSNTPVATWPSDTTISSHPIVPSDQPIVGKISYFCFGVTAMFPCSQADFLAQGQEQQAKQIASLQSQVAKLREQVKALQPPNASGNGWDRILVNGVWTRP